MSYGDDFGDFDLGGRQEPEPFDVGQAELLVDRPLAVRVRLLDRDNEVEWIPKSQIHPNSEVHGDDGAQAGTFIITMWLAEKKGWA